MREDWADDLRDHVARPLHDHRVTLADVLAVDVVLVVQRRVRDRDSADDHGLELSPRIERARPAHADADLVQPGLGGQRRPLERAGPARPAVQRAEPALLLEGVDLDHDSVDLVVELDAPRLPFAARSGDRIERLVPLGERIRAEAELAQRLQRLPVRLAREPFGRADSVHPHGQRARCGDRGVLLPKGPGSSVPRVRRHLLLRSGEPLVQLPEAGERHVDLAAHLEERRRRVAPHAQGDGRDRPQVDRHVLALDPVPPRRAAHEHAAFVGEVDRQPVDLRLEHVSDRLIGLEALAHVLAPLGQRLVRRHFLERAHRLQVLHLLEAVRDRRSHTLRRRARIARARDAPPRARAARRRDRRTLRPRSPGRRGRGSGRGGGRAARGARTLDRPEFSFWRPSLSMLTTGRKCVRNRQCEFSRSSHWASPQ